MVKWIVTKCKWTDLVAHLSHPQGPPQCFHLIHIALCSALQCKSVTGCGNHVYCICVFWGQLKKCYRCTNNRNQMFILVNLWIKLISYSHKGPLNVDLTLLLICLSVFEVNFWPGQPNKGHLIFFRIHRREKSTSLLFLCCCWCVFDTENKLSPHFRIMFHRILFILGKWVDVATADMWRTYTLIALISLLQCV